MSIRVPGATPARPRFDADEIARLTKIATEYNTAYAATPAHRMDTIDALAPSPQDMATMRAFYEFVDDERFPPKYANPPSPGFHCGVFAGSVRRSTSVAYMSRKRNLK